MTSSARRPCSGCCRILRRAIRWAEARDLVGRNVAHVVQGADRDGGRPSKSMTLDQARALLAAASGSPLGAYVTMGMMIGVRNEELRALTWEHVDLVGDPDADPPVPPSVRVWRSVRAGGDTKTRQSRRTWRCRPRWSSRSSGTGSSCGARVATTTRGSSSARAP